MRSLAQAGWKHTRSCHARHSPPTHTPHLEKQRSTRDPLAAEPGSQSAEDILYIHVPYGRKYWWEYYLADLPFSRIFKVWLMLIWQMGTSILAWVGPGTSTMYILPVTVYICVVSIGRMFGGIKFSRPMYIGVHAAYMYKYILCEHSSQNNQLNLSEGRVADYVYRTLPAHGSQALICHLTEAETQSTSHRSASQSLQSTAHAGHRPTVQTAIHVHCIYICPCRLA